MYSWANCDCASNLHSGGGGAWWFVALNFDYGFQDNEYGKQFVMVILVMIIEVK